MQSLGFLGGGQLSRMLVESLQKLRQNKETTAQELCHVEEPHSPVTHVTSHVFKEPLENFLKKCDIVTFENEFISSELFQKSAPEKLLVRPSISLIETLQDKLNQKTLLQTLQIPTARYQIFSNRQEAEKKFGTEYILKWARLGYDGKGVLSVQAGTSDQTISEFVFEAQKRKSPIFVEEKIPFLRELALVAARSVAGEVIVYPLVQTEQSKGVCEWVTSLKKEGEQKLLLLVEPWIKSVLSRLKYVGVLGMELFQTEKGLFVNELAPRVHNSGHYSQWALTESQFDNHVRAALGLKLKPYQRKAEYFGMMNLLGPSGESFRLVKPQTSLSDNMQFYWYDKTHSKPGRKLGHVNFTARSEAEMIEVREKLVTFREKLWQPFLIKGST